jgi:polysaccharide export outer membrane protein
MKIRSSVTLGVALFALAAFAAAQELSAPASNDLAAGCATTLRSNYVLGPEDELEISGPELEELAKPMRVDSDGTILVPLVGRVPVAGLTVQECEHELTRRLSAYFREPQVALTVRELRSQPVSVLGAVKAPGVYQVRGHKTLLEILSLAGGIREDAGYSIRITRKREWGCIPLSDALPDPTGEFSVASVNLQAILQAENPQENIPILPHDVVTVPKAQMVYVIGEVRRSGGFVLGEKKSVSVLQALALAEGLTGTADTRHAKILRVDSAADQRREIAVDVKGILAGKKEDVPLQSNDILFIPGSTGKKAVLRAVEAMVQTVTGIAIWRTP